MWRSSKPIPEPVYPTYVVEQPDYESEPVCMVSVNKQNSQVDQTDELLRKLLEAITPVTPPPVRVPKADPLDKLTELLMSQTVKSEPAPPPPVEPTGVELLLQNYFAKQQSTGIRGHDKCAETGRMYSVFHAGNRVIVPPVVRR